LKEPLALSPQTLAPSPGTPAVRVSKNVRLLWTQKRDFGLASRLTLFSERMRESWLNEASAHKQEVGGGGVGCGADLGGTG